MKSGPGVLLAVGLAFAVAAAAHAQGVYAPMAPGASAPAMGASPQSPTLFNGSVPLGKATAEPLHQSRDRFRAGVTNNVEVVQAQDAVAAANESYISSLYSYDLAKISLARAVGNAEVGVAEYLKGK